MFRGGSVAPPMGGEGHRPPSIVEVRSPCCPSCPSSRGMSNGQRRSPHRRSAPIIALDSGGGCAAGRTGTMSRLCDETQGRFGRDGSVAHPTGCFVNDTVWLLLDDSRSNWRTRCFPDARQLPRWGGSASPPGSLARPGNRLFSCCQRRDGSVAAPAQSSSWLQRQRWTQRITPSMSQNIVLVPFGHSEVQMGGGASSQ